MDHDPTRTHTPVLLNEVLHALSPGAGQTALDCTAGLGGHAAAVAERLGPAGTIALTDLDEGNLRSSEARLLALTDGPRVVTFHTNFADAPRRLVAAGLRADMVLADVGFASNQVADPARGLSFSKDGPLDMRLDPTGPVTAAHLVNTLPAPDLAQIIRDFGEERYAGPIARKLVAERAAAPIETTARLAAIVRSVVGTRGGFASIDPATRTFQALRIAVNDELGNLDALLAQVARAAKSSARGGAGPVWLAADARVAIIAFHSLEDRPVKRAFAALIEQGLASAIVKGPVRATDEETARNPRSRSAKLRALRLGGP